MNSTLPDTLEPILENSKYWLSITPEEIDPEFEKMCLAYLSPWGPSTKGISPPTTIKQIGYLSKVSYARGNRLYWRVGTHLAIRKRPLKGKYYQYNTWVDIKTPQHNKYINFYSLIDLSRSTYGYHSDPQTIEIEEVIDFSQIYFNISKDGKDMSILGIPIPNNLCHDPNLTPNVQSRRSINNTFIPSNKYRLEMIYE